MEDTELEEGEACSYNNNNDDYGATTDPENDLSSLSYIDEKIQHVLGHFQKDFEGGVSAENLGAKFGGYGSFLPTYGRSPSWSHPKSLANVQSYNAPRSPKNMPLEDGCQNPASWASGSQSLRPGPAPTSFGTLPALKATSANDLIKKETSVVSAPADELTLRGELANKKAANQPDRKRLKVRIKVGSDNLSTQKNAAIYSGLGLDVSPSSLEESPSEDEGMYRETQDPLFESPTSIIRFMTLFPVPGEALLSPLPNYLLNLIVKEKIPRENRSDSGKGEGKLLGDKKAKSVEKKDFSAERKSVNNREIRNDNGVVSKKEVDIDALACEDLVSKTLKLPLLSNSYSAVDKIKNKGMARHKGVHDVAVEESVEPVLTQDISLENPRASSIRRVVEEPKMGVQDDISGNARKDGHNRGEKTYDSAKAESNALKGVKVLNIESADPPKQKISQRTTSHEQENMKLPSVKEHASSGGKRNSKGSQSLAAEVPKESLKVGSSSMLKNKQTANNYTNKRELGDQKSERSFRKTEGRYRDFFGDIGESEHEENQTSSLDIHSEDQLKEANKAEKNSAPTDRISVKKSEDLLATKLYPRANVDRAPNLANVNAAGASLATAAPVLIKENWVCCDKCQKWRLLPISMNPADLPEKWLCSMLNWLPGMNRCSVDEEETTRAVFALYQVPAVESQTNLQSNPGNIMSRLPSADALHPDQNQQSIGSHAMPTARKKKHGLKEISNAMDKDGPTFMKKNMQSSIQSGSLNDVSRSPLTCEPGLHHLSKSDLPVEKHKNKKKGKHRLSEHSSDGGDVKSSKLKGKRISDHDSFRASKKIKTETSHLAEEDWMLEHAIKEGPSTSNGLPTTSLGKDQPKHSERSTYKDSKSDRKDQQQVSGKRPKDKVQVSTADGLRDPPNYDGVEVSRKRKVECLDNQLYSGSQQRMGNHPEDCRMVMKEEFSENDYRKEKKARASKSGGKDSSASKSSGKLEKKGRHTKNLQNGQDLGCALSQRSLDGQESSKRDCGSAQPSLAATSSSSKISGSHKSKPGLHETKGSPVESVSSSPMRTTNPDKLPSTRNVTGKDESHNVSLHVAVSPRKCSDGEDNGRNDRSWTVRKETTFTAAQYGSHESSIHDTHDKDGFHLGGNRARAPIESSPDVRKSKFVNGSVDCLGQEAQYAGKSTKIDEHHDDENQIDNQGNAKFSHPRKTGKGSLWSKERSYTSDPVDERQDHAPPQEVKPRDGRNKFQERLGVRSDESDKRFVHNKESVKFLGECGKRESLSNVGCSDDKPDTTEGQDLMSTVKQNFVQDSDGEKYSKRFHSNRSDHAEVASERGNSVSLPPTGGIQNGTPTHVSHVVSGSQNGNGPYGSQGDDTLKLQKQIKKADHQNGTQHSSSRRTTSGECRIRDVDAPSPMRKDSLSQAATNLLKEAKDLKHTADRVKSSSNEEGTALYFEAALKFLHGASLLESSNNDSTKHGEMIQSLQIYSSTAKLCEFCAHEYERLKHMAAASLAYKCMEVAYMRVIYSSHANASRDRNELQTALQMVPPGESPSSSASDVDNLNHATVDKVALPKGISSPQVAGNHVISARNRPNFVRLLNFAQDVYYAMEASRKSRIAFQAANSNLGGAESEEGTSSPRKALDSVKKALDFNFQDVEGVLRLVRVAMEAIG